MSIFTILKQPVAISVTASLILIKRLMIRSEAKTDDAIKTEIAHLLIKVC